MKKVPIFSEFFRAACSLGQAASNAPTFGLRPLKVSEIKIQVARDPELNLGNHTSSRNLKLVHVYEKIPELCAPVAAGGRLAYLSPGFHFTVIL